MRDDDVFDDLIRQSANHHEATVPADAWDNINQKKKKRRGFFWWWWLTGILLLGGAGFWLATQQKQTAKYADATMTDTAEKKATDKGTSSENETNTLTEINTLTKEKKATTDTDTAQTDGATTHDKRSVTNATGNAEETDNTITNNQTKDNSNSSTNKKLGTAKSNKENTKNNENNDTTNKQSSAATGQKQTIASNNHLPKNEKSIAKKTTKKERINNGRQATATGIAANEKSSQTPEQNNSLPDANHANVIKKGSQKGKTNIAITDGNIVGTSLKKRYDTNGNLTGEKSTASSPINTEEPIDIIKDNNNTTVVIDSKKDNDIIAKADSNVAAIGDTTAQITHDSTAKNQNKKKGKKLATGKWWIDISATPFASIAQNDKLTTLTRTANMGAYTANYTASSIKISQETAIAYAVALRKNINAKWAVGVGIQYQQIKEKIYLAGSETHTTKTVVQRLVQNQGGPALVSDTITTIATGTRTINALNSYKFVSVPVFVTYHLVANKSWLIDWNVGGFINVSRKYSNSIGGVFTRPGNTGNIPASSKSKWGLDLFTEVRISKPINKYLMAFVAPGFRYNLTEYKMQGMLNNILLHQAGVSVGVSFKLQ